MSVTDMSRHGILLQLGREGEAYPEGRGRACLDGVGLRRGGGLKLYGAKGWSMEENRRIR